MGGNRAGGLKAAATIRERCGNDFYSRIGRRGGMNSNNGGFASKKVGADGLTGKQRARIAGAKGGSASRRTNTTNSKKKVDELEPLINNIEKEYRRENRSLFKRLFKR